MIDGQLARLEIGSVHRINSVATTIGLTLREFLVLAELTHHPTGLMNAQISGIVGLPSATVTELLTRLGTRGLVARVPDPFDRRTVAALPTDEAERLLSSTRGDASDFERRRRLLLSGMDASHLIIVAEFLLRATNRAYGSSRVLREHWR